MGNTTSSDIAMHAISDLHLDTLGYVVINKYDVDSCGAGSAVRRLGDDQYEDDDSLPEYDQAAGCSTGLLIGQCDSSRGTMLGFTYGHDSQSQDDDTLLNVVELQFPHLDCSVGAAGYAGVNSTRVASYPINCMPLALRGGEPVYFGSYDSEDGMYGGGYYVRASFVPLYNSSGVYDELFPWDKSPSRAQLAADASIVDAINGEETDDDINVVVGYYMHTTSVDAASCRASFDVFRNSSAAYRAHLNSVPVDHFTSYFWMREDFCHGRYRVQCEEVGDDPDDMSFTLWRTNYGAPEDGRGACADGLELPPSIPLTAAMASASACTEGQPGSGVASDYMYCTSQNMSAIPEPSSFPTGAPSSAPAAAAGAAAVPSAAPSSAPHGGGKAPMGEPFYFVTTQFASVEDCADFVTPRSERTGGALAVRGTPINMCVSDHVSSSYYYSSSTSAAGVVSVLLVTFGTPDCTGHAHVAPYRSFQRLNECLPGTLRVHSGEAAAGAHGDADCNAPRDASVPVFSFTVAVQDAVAPWSDLGRFVRLPPSTAPPQSFNSQSTTVRADGLYQFSYARADFSSCIERTGPDSERDFSYLYYGSEFLWTPLSTCVAGQVFSCGGYGAVSAYSGDGDGGEVVYSMPVPNTRVQEFASPMCEGTAGPREWWVRAYVCRPCPDEHGYCVPQYAYGADVSGQPVSAGNAALGSVICKDSSQERAQLQAFLSDDDGASTSQGGDGVDSWRHLTWHQLFVRVAGYSIATQLFIGVVLGLVGCSCLMLVCICRRCCQREVPKNSSSAAIPVNPNIVYNPLPNKNADDAVGYDDFVPGRNPGDDGFYDDDEDDLEMVPVDKSSRRGPHRSVYDDDFP